MPSSCRSSRRSQDDDARFQPLARTAIEANFVNGVS
jgi:hypothetical protein